MERAARADTTALAAELRRGGLRVDASRPDKLGSSSSMPRRERPFVTIVGDDEQQRSEWR
jgi:hypothetical protein